MISIKVNRIDKYKEAVVEGYNGWEDVTIESGVLDHEEAVELSKEFMQAALDLLEE